MESIDFIVQIATMEHPSEQIIWELGFYKTIHKNKFFVWVHVIT